MSRPDETYEAYCTPDTFCETLTRIERVGSCRRLVFTVSTNEGRAVVAKLIVPGEAMADIAQMIAADRPEPGTAFARLPINAVAH